MGVNLNSMADKVASEESQNDSLNPNKVFVCGRAVVVPHQDGGWALPGGDRALTERDARHVAFEIDWLMKTLGS